MAYDATPPPPPLPRAAAIAPWPHTVALFAVLLITAIAGHSRVASGYLDTPRIPRYIATILSEWLLLGAVIAGIYLRRDFFLSAFAHRTRGLWQSLGLGCAVYVASALLVGLVRALFMLTPLPHSVNLEVVLAMAPRTPLDFFVWFFLALSAGVCEELIFRGYLLQQITAWTGRPVLAIVLGGLLFGGVHVYEGLGAILPLATLGIVYGFVVRYFKGDLRAVMAAHFLQDFLVAFFAIAIRHIPLKDLPH